ncbi:hypothetical protein L1I30_12960 [Gillisia sp. M10.2A]|uniref:Histidine kinase N-terminal 7TM region domain-containing protein n=1 Tax=Gillisia lutea TaxID=2909668 RepID=A0ABS9EK92_9FLAO|nr:hypothetical protein [Gillisia lutea]MCF4102579.1 hypothetical protein [Gillisia lutea]
MLDYIIENKIYVVYIFEFLAAVSGAYYLKVSKSTNKGIVYFIYGLWLTIFIELIALYSPWSYFEGYKTFPYIEYSVFKHNYWLYNSFKIISFSIFFNLFIYQLSSPKTRRVLYGLMGFFVISSLLNLILTDAFFKAISSYTTISGSILLLICVGAYYYDILKSDKILLFYRNIPFYSSIAFLVWHLSTTPIYIYNRYFSLKNPHFVDFHFDLFRYSNVFMYSCFIIGFLVCSKWERSQSGKSKSSRDT